MAAERKEREREVAADLAKVREVAVLEAAKVVLAEREAVAAALAEEREEVTERAAEMVETLTQEVGKTEKG